MASVAGGNTEIPSTCATPWLALVLAAAALAVPCLARAQPAAPPAPAPPAVAPADAEPADAEPADAEPADAEATESEAAEADPDAAEPTSAAPRRPLYSLGQCLRLAERNYPKVLEARARLASKRAKVFESRTQPFSEFRVQGGIAPAPTVRGTPIYSPDSDVALTSDMGVAWEIGVEGLVPLWTFGKIGGTWDAVDAQVKVGEHEVRKEKNQVRLAVRQAYYGAMLARDALALIGEAEGRIDKYLGTLEEHVKKGEQDEIDLFKVQVYREDLRARRSEAEKQAAIALAGLRFLTGVVGDIDVPDLPLARVSHRLAPLARYLSAARAFRPEVNMARAGVLAREALARVERARYFPDVGLALSARWANAPEVTDQRNPFARDAGHAQSYGAALAFRYKLDFLPQSARVAQAEAVLEEQRATERYALGGVGVEVEQAFREAEDAERRLNAYTRAATVAKRWLVQIQQGIDVGTLDEEEVVDPAKEYALKRFAQMSATYDYNMAVSRLALATGWDAIAAEPAP